MKNFVVGLILGVLLLPVLAFVLIRLGYVPVATAAPPLPLERTLAAMALGARIAKEAPKNSPVLPSEPNLLAGATLYRTHCAVCHGTPGEPRTAIAKGMFPRPPQLVEGKGVTDDPVGETFWKAANGIRLTGMPAYRGSLTDEQLWQVSQLLANADKLPPGVRALLVQPPPAH
jgi:mono/diheme cytochrome c family protein